MKRKKKKGMQNLCKKLEKKREEKTPPKPALFNPPCQNPNPGKYVSLLPGCGFDIPNLQGCGSGRKNQIFTPTRARPYPQMLLGSGQRAIPWPWGGLCHPHILMGVIGSHPMPWGACSSSFLSISIFFLKKIN
jgi:hypothetical protein